MDPYIWELLFLLEDDQIGLKYTLEVRTPLLIVRVYHHQKGTMHHFFQRSV